MLNETTNTQNCPYCGNAAKFVTGEAIYPHRKDLFYKRFYECKPCDAYVGCHDAVDSDGKNGLGDGTIALGRLANKELRQAKMAVHAVFDPLWKNGSMARKHAYNLLATKLKIKKEDCHVGMFDVETCRKVIEICKSGL